MSFRDVIELTRFPHHHDISCGDLHDTLYTSHPYQFFSYLYMYLSMEKSQPEKVLSMLKFIMSELSYKIY